VVCGDAAPRARGAARRRPDAAVDGGRVERQTDRVVADAGGLKWRRLVMPGPEQCSAASQCRRERKGSRRQARRPQGRHASRTPC
jgi:hypothetical protein